MRRGERSSGTYVGCVAVRGIARVSRRVFVYVWFTARERRDSDESLGIASACVSKYRGGRRGRFEVMNSEVMSGRIWSDGTVNEKEFRDRE